MESMSGRLCSLRGEDLNSSNSYYTKRSDSTVSRKLARMTGSLEILDEGLVKPSIDCSSNSRLMSPADSSSNSRPMSGMSSSRPVSRASTGSVPPRSDSSISRRINTPIKQVSLQAVPRKVESGESFKDSVCWNSVRLETKEKHIWQLENKSADVVHLKANTQESSPAEASDRHQLETVTQLSMCSQILSATEPRQADPVSGLQVDQVSDLGWDTSEKEGAVCGEDEPSDDKEEEDTSSEGDEEDSDEEDKKLVAPNELLMEFVDSLMRKEYQIANKLCQMILLFEPENAEALKFQPLIKEKLELDAEAAKAASLEEEDDDEDENDSEGDDDSDDEEDDDVDNDDNEDESSDADDSSSSGDEGTSSSEDNEQPTEIKSRNSAS